MKNSPKEYFLNILRTVVILIFSLLVFFPLYWMTCTSLKEEGEIFRIPPSFIPVNPTIENFEYALTQTQVPVFFINSLVYVIGTLIVSLLCASMAAYSISRFKFKGKAAYLGVILLTQLMPITTLIVPLYVSFGSMHLLNNRAALIIVYSALQIPIGTWLFLGYFNTIPRDIDEAARIDGCTNFMILFRIVIPLSKAGFTAVGISSAISVWQELILAMTFSSKDTIRPLMAGVSASITRSGIRWGQMTATGVIACIPVLIIYIFCQRYLIRGLTSGAVKG
jgi:multiple sugar transport system permease protein